MDTDCQEGTCFVLGSLLSASVLFRLTTVHQGGIFIAIKPHIPNIRQDSRTLLGAPRTSLIVKLFNGQYIHVCPEISIHRQLLETDPLQEAEMAQLI